MFVCQRLRYQISLIIKSITKTKTKKKEYTDNSDFRQVSVVLGAHMIMIRYTITNSGNHNSYNIHLHQYSNIICKHININITRYNYPNRTAQVKEKCGRLPNKLSIGCRNRF